MDGRVASQKQSVVPALSRDTINTGVRWTNAGAAIAWNSGRWWLWVPCFRRDDAECVAAKTRSVLRLARSRGELTSRLPLSQRDRLVAAAFGGFCYGFGPGARAQFAEHRFDVEFDGMQRDIQTACDRLVGH